MYIVMFLWGVVALAILTITTLHSRKPTLGLHNLCMKILTLYGNELCLFGGTLQLILLMLQIWHCSRKYLYVFSYNAFWAENWTHHLPDAERMRYVSCHRTRTVHITIKFINALWHLKHDEMYLFIITYIRHDFEPIQVKQIASY